MKNFSLENRLVFEVGTPGASAEQQSEDEMPSGEKPEHDLKTDKVYQTWMDELPGKDGKELLDSLFDSLQDCDLISPAHPNIAEARRSGLEEWIKENSDAVKAAITASFDNLKEGLKKSVCVVEREE